MPHKDVTMFEKEYKHQHTFDKKMPLNENSRKIIIGDKSKIIMFLFR